MAKINENQSERPQPSSEFAKPAGVGKRGDRGDTVIVPGDGVYLSRHRKYDFEREVNKDGVSDYHVMLIPEEAVLMWAEKIKCHRRMEESRRAEYEKKCHEGTDTEDPAKDPNVINNGKRNYFSIDRSRSTMSISVASGTSRYLNSSAVKHNNWVLMDLTAPDGRRYGRLEMSYDQLASALVSNSPVPITWSDFWDVNEDSVLLTEVVHPPERIDQRMEQRLRDTIGGLKKITDRIRDRVNARVDAGKSMPKTELQEVIRDIDTVESFLKANTDFVVGQALEETTSIVERAAMFIALQHGVQTSEIADNSLLGKLLGDGK